MLSIDMQNNICIILFIILQKLYIKTLLWSPFVYASIQQKKKKKKVLRHIQRAYTGDIYVCVYIYYHIIKQTTLQNNLRALQDRSQSYETNFVCSPNYCRLNKLRRPTTVEVVLPLSWPQ